MTRPPIFYHWLSSEVQDAMHRGGLTLDACTAISTVPREWTYRALTYFQPSETKVVILGQDPYHTIGKPTGLAFGIREDYPGRRDYSSLGNIIAECTACGYPPPRTDEDVTKKWATLESWARQGVLLLNTVLSTEPGKPHSHAGMGWEIVVEAILRQVMEKAPTAIWLAWGAEARHTIKQLHKSKVRHMIATSHPTKYSAGRGSTHAPAFRGSQWPSQVNQLLHAMGQTPIDWGQE